MNHGFQLRKLQITGPNVPSAEISFRAGFNVITGPSDTGKSYIYQCINFMLGGNVPPKQIKESTGYSTIYLEITTNDDQMYTLERAIRGGEINLFSGTIADLNTSNTVVNVKVLRDEHDENELDNISTFLLSLSGIDQNIKIRKNIRFETVNLTFRTIYQLFLVDEERIIENKSPIYGQSGFSNTSNKWAFHYLLTGENDNSLISLPDPKIIKAQSQARLLVYDDLISELEEKTKRLRDNSEGFSSQLSELENRISEQANAVSVSSGEIAGQQQKRQSLWNQQQEADSRIIAIDELLLRFSLLKNHYETDLERLEFMSQGDYYFQQLETVNCPLCGTPLEDHESRQRCIEKNGEFIDLQTAAKQESDKISLHLKDLEQTFNTLEQERNLLGEDSEKYKSEIIEIDRHLNEILTPRLVTEKSLLDQLLKGRRIIDELEINTNRLQELWILRANSVSKQSKGKPNQKVNINLDGIALRGLCDQIKLLLKAWKYPETGVVEFNEKVMDISVNGKSRKSHGKGVRALFHSAFNIGLMQFSSNSNRPHPKLVVLDSPLLNFKQRKPSETTGEVSGEVKQAFFANLANIPNYEQIIIFENEPVPSRLKNKINVTEFVGQSGGGRVGFFE